MRGYVLDALVEDHIIEGHRRDMSIYTSIYKNKYDRNFLNKSKEKITSVCFPFCLIGTIWPEITVGLFRLRPGGFNPSMDK